MNCFALALDTDHACELHLFRTEAERDAFMWNYAFTNNDTDAKTLENFMAEYDGDLSYAMQATNDGWHTDDMLAETTIEAATMAALVKAEAVLADEVERRGDADETVYEIKAGPALEAVRAVIGSHVNVSAADGDQNG